MPNVTINLGFLQFELTREDFISIQHRATRSALFHGPCLLLNRQNGLALDARADAHPGTNPIIWSAHAAPWQQWRLETVGTRRARIISEPTKLVLTPAGEPWDWSPVSLQQLRNDDSQAWRLREPTTESLISSNMATARTP